MKSCIAAFVLLSCAAAWAQDEDEREYVAACSLSIKTAVMPLVKGDRAGSVQIIVYLSENTGTPVPNQVVTMSATNGTFSCMAPGEDSASSAASDRSCFITGPDGRVKVYLVDVPFNNPGRIKASCTYGDFSLAASGSYSISRPGKKKAVRRSAVTPSMNP